MSNTIKGFKTLSGEAYYDYDYLENKPSIPQRVSDLQNDKNYINGAYVQDNYLYLTSAGLVVEGPLGPFGAGGGGADLTYKITLINLLDTNFITVAEGSSVILEFDYSSVDESGIGDGAGIGSIIVQDNKKASFSVKQGENKVEVTPYLTAGSNTVRVMVENSEGTKKSIGYEITVAVVSLTSAFDSNQVFSGPILFNYTPTGLSDKVMHIFVDEVEILPNKIISTSGREQTLTIPAQRHGAHIIKAYFDCVINNVAVTSNTLHFSIICVEEGVTTPILSSSFQSYTIEQFNNIVIPYKVYNPVNLTSAVTLTANDKVVGVLANVDRTIQKWTYRADKQGELRLKITTTDPSNGEEVSIGWTMNVAESTIQVSPETSAMALYLTSYGRSNNESEPNKWEYEGISANFSNFNWVSDGWVQDKDDITVLRVSGDARVTIPYKIFSYDFRTSGKTIEIEFASRDVLNYDAIIFDCLSNNIGMQLSAQKAFIKSELSYLETLYKEDEHVRISFVVEKRSAHRLLTCYINGIISGAVQYAEDDDFSQSDAVNITIGSNDCTIDIYNIRIYDNDLTRYQILDNWIADTQNSQEMIERYNRNNIYDSYGQIIIENLPKDLPYMVLQSKVLPQFKGDKKDVDGYYVDPLNPTNSFRFTGAQCDVQGTSSQHYTRKNYKIKFRNGFVLNDGTTLEKYAMNEVAVPTATFTFKADVASSEGANNVELVRLYNDICPYLTPPQQAEYEANGGKRESIKIRQGIDGFPIVIFWDNSENVSFLGKYNFNNDKGTPEVFGMDANDESWEIKNNDPGRAMWESADFSGDDWKNDFEARHPEDNVDTTRLAALARWLVSTDQKQATNAALAQTYVDVDGKSHTIDNAAYRLAKFKTELEDHFDKDGLIFNYLFTELFLLTDSRAKNAFPTIYDDTKWTILPYDMDTALGIDNLGKLSFGYELEDIDKTGNNENVFNGQDSVLYVNTRQAFFDDIKEMYQNLRSNDKLSYNDTQERFATHQAKWPEAIFNEDAYFKYLEPLFSDNDTSYLEMLLGSKAEQRKWWLYNRYRYIDSKYHAKDAQTDVINFRAYNRPQTINISTYADIYFTLQSGSRTSSTRTFRNRTYEISVPQPDFASGEANEAETYIFSASQVADLGDLSQFYIGRADFSKGTRLQRLIIGSADENYNNTNLEALTIGNNKLLRVLDVRNCSALVAPQDVSGCTNIEEIYFEGTGITNIKLPNGGILKTLHLPETVVNLSVINQPQLTDFYIPSYNQISTLRLENAGALDAVALDILNVIQDGSRVRLLNVNFGECTAEQAMTLLNRLDVMRGLDESGNTMSVAQVSGTIYIPSVSSGELHRFQSKYPSIKVTYDTIAMYTVRFFNGEFLLQTVENVNYNDSVVYTGKKPIKDGEVDESRWRFVGWDPDPSVVTGNMDCYAQFEFCGALTRELIMRTISGDYVNDSVATISQSAFSACKKLTSVTFTKATTANTSAFATCTALIRADFTVLTSLSANAFSTCRILNTIILRSNTIVTLANINVFNTCDHIHGTVDATYNPDGAKDGYIYVPRALVDSYKSATNWSTFADQIRAIEDYPEICGGEN